jgi:hypothetical protein
MKIKYSEVIFHFKENEEFSLQSLTQFHDSKTHYFYHQEIFPVCFK